MLCRKHQVLFFSAANNTYWRTHDRELQCNNLHCYCHNFHIIKNYINNTKYTLDLCMYLFTSEEIAQTVLDAHLRGIKIRIITDFEMSHSSGSKMEVFQSHGIQVRFKKATNCLMHHKFCLLDANTENGVLMTGSLNLTMQAVAGNWDNAIFTTQTDLIQQFQQEFNRIWSSFD
ncbi:mitochondrial cardiolipin hydrolase-like [Chrysoperla carnea]|uniref:mitochondrial cardiolipin hydrolase-like n=1 Tax=Chrysoperla carnea TaxID=189513 RepID=UPI001D05D6D3|nr:mitochondrial cardiolipin hydrolase-like [Chrysoperla carnea]